MSRFSSSSLGLALLLATVLAGCGGSTSTDPPSTDSEGALGSRRSTTRTTIEEEDIAMLPGEPGQQLAPFGCRHYMALGLYNGDDGAAATFDARLDSADRRDMEGGGCGGEELPPSDRAEYVLHEVSKDRCGARVLEGTIEWSDSGRVTRTLRVHDSRKTTCGTPEARVVVEELRALDGDSHLVETYYSVDPPAARPPARPSGASSDAPAQGR
jgi:hypothetical protein